MKSLYFFLSLAATIFPLFAAEYTVSSIEEFNDLSLSAGDVVTWTDGTYSEEGNIDFAGTGTAGNPITLKAETIGGVTFTDSVTMTLSADYAIVEGFYWNGGDGQNNHIQFRNGSTYANYSTIRNCAMNNLAPSGTDKHRWIVFYGTNNTVESCSFTNKSSPGALLLVELAYNDFNPVQHTMRNNYFFNYENRETGTEHAGDSETIRVGTSQYQDKSASCLIEGNYFQECDGENEIITNKSANNTYLYNTFRNCFGSLVMRHGANAYVEGNYFLGENKPDSGGIRVSDSNHVIINNYFQDLNNDGNIWNNAITLVGGDATSGGTSSEYQKVDNILVAFNTIYNCDDPLYYNPRASHDPTGVFAYNVSYSTSTDGVGGDISGTGQGMTYVGNIFGGGTIGITDAGFTNANANFSQSGEIFTPSNSGVAANAAGSAYSNIVGFDIQGRTRQANSMDAGAHEVSGATGAVTHAAHLTDAEVGIVVGAPFVNAEGIYTGATTGADFISVGNISAFSANASSQTVSVSSNVSWTASEGANWITITPTSGTGNGSIEISVASYSGASARSAVLTVTDGTITRTLTVTQNAPVPDVDVIGVSLSPETQSLTVGTQLQLSANLSPNDATDQTVTYSSSDTTVASVSSSGLVTASAEGSATITVTTNDGSFTDTAVITVIQPSEGTNLALNKTVIGQEDQAENPLSNLTDGDSTNRYSVENVPQSVTVDLGATYNLDYSELITYQERDYQYTISVATAPNGPYTEVVDRTDNSTGGTDDSPLIDALDASGRYVMITITGFGPNYSGPWISLNEFRVYGEQGTATSPYYEWLEESGITAQSPTADTDNDGVSNIIEYALGGSLESADIPLQPIYEETAEGYTIKLTRDPSSLTDTTHILEYSTNLLDWTRVDISNDDASNVSFNTTSANQEEVEVMVDIDEVPERRLLWRFVVESTY
ncbi:MAG: chondroitinase-B domain-containing protein [Akkermansiaceae bacterium]